MKVPPRFELGLPESEPDVITTYTMGPYPELLCRTNTNFLPAPTIIESTTCTQKTLNSSSSLQPTLLKHGINGTTKRNNTEDQKALNSKQQSVYTKQTGGYMMYLCHFKLGSGMICGTVFRVYCLHSQKLAAGTWTIIDTLSYSQWYNGIF